jgi:hypothetical protein
MPSSDRILFLHGGISPAVAALPCATINDTVRRELSGDINKTRESPLTSLAAREDGPLWYRGWALEPDSFEPRGDEILASQHARAIVVAHSVQADGRIHVRFSGKAFLIDTGMQAAYAPDGRASALGSATACSQPSTVTDARLDGCVERQAPGPPRRASLRASGAAASEPFAAAERASRDAAPVKVGPPTRRSRAPRASNRRQCLDADDCPRGNHRRPDYVHGIDLPPRGRSRRRIRIGQAHPPLAARRQLRTPRPWRTAARHRRTAACFARPIRWPSRSPPISRP